jgi:hypothetical protein
MARLYHFIVPQRRRDRGRHRGSNVWPWLARLPVGPTLSRHHMWRDRLVRLNWWSSCKVLNG